MKKKLLLIISLFSLNYKNNAQSADCAQPTKIEILQTNTLYAGIPNSGDMFWDMNTSKFGVRNSNNSFIQTIFTGSIILAGKKPNNQIALASNQYRASNKNDFWAGTVENNGTTNEDCRIWNKIWTVTSNDINWHLAQFREGRVTDSVAAIFAYPGRNNPFFDRFNDFSLPQDRDLAPFFDKNGDGNYTPQYGDYPLPEKISKTSPPDIMMWHIFNDVGNLHTNSDRAEPIGAEIHRTTWAYKSSSIPDNCLFMRHKIINKGTVNLDSFYIGLFIDFDLGCFTDDFVGSYPPQNTFYVYNKYPIDSTHCNNNDHTFGNNPPVQAVSFLNRPLSKFVTNQPNVPQSNISTARALFNRLAGKAIDGTPLTRGNDGYNPTSTDTLSHTYPDLPLDTAGWSLYQMQNAGQIISRDFRTYGSTYVGRFNVSDTASLDVVYSFHRKNEGNNIANVYEMVNNMPLIFDLYNSKFDTLRRINPLPRKSFYTNIYLYPNPNDGLFNIESDNELLEGAIIYNSLGEVLWEKDKIDSFYYTINFKPKVKGIYYVKVKTENNIYVKKILISAIN